MAILPLLLTALMAGGAAAGLFKKKTTQDGSQLPTAADPNVWSAGSTAARRAGGASGSPQAARWATAGGFLSTMPGLIGR